MTATAFDAAGNSTVDSTTNELLVDLVVPVVKVNPLTMLSTKTTLTGTVTDAYAFQRHRGGDGGGRRSDLAATVTGTLER